MKIFVTGASGLLGSAVVRHALRNGHHVSGVDIVPLPADIHLSEDSTFTLIPFERCKDLIPLMQECDALVHTAGLHGGALGNASWEEFFESNLMATIRLLENASACGITRAVVSSTMEILFGKKWSASGMCVLDESSPPQCDSPYSLSRLLLEKAVQQMAATWKMSIACLRFMAFDSRADHELGPDLLCRYISVRDAAGAVFAALESELIFEGEIFHIGPESRLLNCDIPTVFTDFYAVLEKYYPGASESLRKQEVRIDPRQFWPVASIRKAETILKWRPQITFAWWLNFQRTKIISALNPRESSVSHLVAEIR